MKPSERWLNRALSASGRPHTDSRASLSKRFQQSDRGPGCAPVVVDFVADYQAFGIGSLREVLGRSQPGTVGLLRREQPFASVSKDGRVIAGSDLRQNVDREAGREAKIGRASCRERV